ncbi:alpha/beta hydrolase [Flagellimonas meridianipacifica]|uniref:alpha/beta hydrolase n=1 Tax=Flagellimonas meridianipacifica TaxID=1080225 RepID=UPI000D05C4E2|nr:alpha/beta hydrolase-fold protein [Allomuricauda pacifica]
MRYSNVIFSVLFSLSVNAQTTQFLLESLHLNRSISITAFDTAPEVRDKPIVYLTDGQKMIENGSLNVIETLTRANKVPVAFYVFVSTIDEASGVDFRNEYFFCNENYRRFFEEELIPHIEESVFPLGRKRKSKERSLVGISFGGLNAAYFSATATSFQSYGILSPVTYPCQQELMKHIAFSKNKDLKIFLSTGTNDAERYLPPLKASYEGKGYQVKVHKTDGAHDFDNWNKQWEVVLAYLLK